MSDRATPENRWRYGLDALRDAVASSRSYRQVLLKLGLCASGGGAYETLKRRIDHAGIDTSHFTGQGWNTGDSAGLLKRREIPLDEALRMDSPVTNYGRLKQRLIRQGMLENRCAICGMPPEWRSAPLVMRLDHINGDRTDARLENLRLLCPNCDSQLPTFAGRNKCGKNGSSHHQKSRRPASAHSVTAASRSSTDASAARPENGTAAPRSR